MRYICDLHIHSRYAQACSKDLSVATLEKWAKLKGVDILGTGDFTHPEWIKELKQELLTEKEGIFSTKGGQKFILQTEISLIYTQERGRKVHLLVYAPSFDVVDKITTYLLGFGRVDYDGRPIFKIPCWQFVKDLKAIDSRIEVIPAHAWTPWFSVFGSRSGFDSLQEAFKEQLHHIRSIETGLSSDVEMNDRIGSLKEIRYVSFSDAHSFWPWRLGREATIIEVGQLTYGSVMAAITDGPGFWGTIEVEPSYGKYHLDGHRACDVVLAPDESNSQGKICPKCKQPLTIGVLNRVEELATATVDKESQRSIKLLPLHEILSLVLGKGLTTKTVWTAYWEVMKAGKNELDILMNVGEEELAKHTTPEIAAAIIQIRNREVTYTAGYDGVYGIPRFKEQPLKKSAAPSQVRLDSFTG